MIEVSVLPLKFIASLTTAQNRCHEAIAECEEESRLYWERVANTPKTKGFSGYSLFNGYDNNSDQYNSDQYKVDLAALDKLERMIVEFHYDFDVPIRVDSESFDLIDKWNK